MSSEHPSLTQEVTRVEPGRVGTNLRRLLGMHDITQRELASYLGLSAQGIWNIVHGRSEPRAGTALRAAQAFGVGTDALFSDTGTCLRAAAEAFECAPIRRPPPD